VELAWRFERQGQRLEIRRAEATAGVRLEVTVNGSPRSYPFADLAAAIRFQSDMEDFLLKTGWSFVEFAPERRTGRDRRDFPRLSERRRWWTDGMTTLKKIVWG